MAKTTKKASTSTSSNKLPAIFQGPWRWVDGILLLVVGFVAALSLFMYQGLRTDLNEMMAHQSLLQAQISNQLTTEINQLRQSVQELQTKNTVATAPKVGGAEKTLKKLPKGKRKIQSVDGTEEFVDESEEALPEFQFRLPATNTVDGRDHSKSLHWVIVSLAQWIAWLMVLSGLLVIIAKMLQNPPMESSDEP